MTEFTPLLSLIGGLVVGCAAVFLMASHGRIAGVTGIVSSLIFPGHAGDRSWRAAFIAGMICSPLILLLATGTMPEITVLSSTPMLILGGLLIGFGASMGSGCTSGHGVCGMARLSKRSIAATVTFMAAGFLTVFIMRHWIGG